MTPSLTDSLDAIAGYLVSMRRPVVPLLKDGIAQPEIARRLASKGLSTSDDLLVLYEWHNGTKSYPGDILDDIQIVPGYFFPDLEEALDNYSTFKSDPRWNPFWLPVLANGGGDFYAVDCSTNPKTRGNVHSFMMDEAEHPVEYTSLSSMFATFAEAYRRGIYFLHSAGYLDANDRAYFDLAKVLNPDAPAWSIYAP